MNQTLSQAVSAHAPPREAKIIVFFNQKGGAGKSQSSMQIGASLALRGFKVLIVDLDMQSTATIWSGRASDDQPFPASVVSLAAQKNVISELRKMAQLFDFIVIDCRPALDDEATWSILHVADIGIIPTIPLLDNIWASVEAKEKGLHAKQKNPHLKLYYLPSIVARGNVYRKGISLLKQDKEIGTFNSYFSHRSTFPECQYSGTSVHSLGPRAKSAIADVEAVTDELLGYLNED